VIANRWQPTELRQALAVIVADAVGHGVLLTRWHHVGMAAPQVLPIEETHVEVDEVPQTDRPWVTVVWNDPVNLMSYVTWVLQKLFGYSKEKAERLMLDVHHKGKAIVSSGQRERMEYDASRLQAYGLWATVDRS
jgi:ATP-dependent Clp protease adaptor protein ClpS